MMLRVVRRPDGAAPAGEARPIVAAGTRIGRAPECDLVLDDVLRLVSRQHAWLAPQGSSAALLKCISTTAAIHVNGEPLPPGAERLVHDGDLLRFGGFEVLVEIEPQTVVVKRPALPLRPMPVPVAPPPVAPTIVSMPRRPAAVSSGVAKPPARDPEVARGGRLDRHFDLDTVADPLGPGSPLPAAAMAPAPMRQHDAAGPTTIVRPSVKPITAPVVPPVAPAPTVSPAVQAFDASLSRAAAAVRAAEPSPLAPPPPPPAAPEPVAPPVQAANSALQALRHAFLHGAGLDDEAEFQVDPAWMEHLGALLRASTDGTLALLRSRAVAKRSIRAENTQIVARENNPLKFAPDGVHALLLLLSLQSRRGFLEPVAAVRDAHADLQVHQLAMAAGMRAAVFELISRLGPEATEAAEGPAHGLAQSIPALRDAALWRRHKLGHERMLENLDDVFEAAFGREFLKAYEAQAKKADPPLGPPETP